MKRKSQVCVEIEPDLVAAATGDAEPGAALRVEQHIDSCGACRGEYDRYREIEGVVGALRGAPAAAESVARARQGLESRLADLKSRLVSYRVFSSPLGRILIARSEHGVSLVEYLDGGVDLSTSRLRRIAGVELQEDGAEVVQRIGHSGFAAQCLELRQALLVEFQRLINLNPQIEANLDLKARLDF